MKRFPRPLFLALCLLLPSGCMDITHVQTGYVADRDECRGRAEHSASVYAQPDSYPLSNRDKNAALLQLFCECMKDKDWRVAGCPKPPVAVAAAPQPQPTVVVVQSPASQPALLPTQQAPAYVPAPEPAPQPAAAVHKAKKKKPKACVPPGTCPAPDYGSGGAGQTPLPADRQLNGILQRQ